MVAQGSGLVSFSISAIVNDIPMTPQKPSSRLKLKNVVEPATAEGGKDDVDVEDDFANNDDVADDSQPKRWPFEKFGSEKEEKETEGGTTAGNLEPEYS